MSASNIPLPSIRCCYLCHLFPLPYKPRYKKLVTGKSFTFRAVKCKLGLQRAGRSVFLPPQMSARSVQHRRRHSRQLYWKCWTWACPCSCSEKLCAPTFSCHSVEPKVPNSWVRCNCCLLQCCAELQSQTETSPRAWRFSNGRELAEQFHTPCWAQHKRREERAKSTACSIPAHPQPSQQVLVATGSQAQQQQPGCHKFQQGTSPVTCFIAQDQASTATAASLFSELLWQLLGCGKRPRPPHRSWASSTRQLRINS